MGLLPPVCRVDRCLCFPFVAGLLGHMQTCLALAHGGPQDSDFSIDAALEVSRKIQASQMCKGSPSQLPVHYW